jgi:ATP-dependent NAD(P)H-hydrate dehydratase
LIPPLGPTLYKGQMGKVVVVGGCQEYTGAPFFAAYSALKMGADLAHVFCTTEAAPVIKGYSPELIVHPYLDETHAPEDVLHKLEPWMEKFSRGGSCVIVGPGLGRHPTVVAQAMAILSAFNDRGVPIVLDADGLWILSQDQSWFRDLKRPDRLVLTPNVAELARLDGIDVGAATVVKKGPVDDIRQHGRTVYTCDEPGSLRRAGGQGDVLTGCIATFIAWNARSSADVDLAPSALAGCVVARRASRRAFEAKGRAMGATDVIEELGRVINDLEDKERA